MREIIRKRRELDPADWVGKAAKERDYGTLEREPFVLRDSEDGPMAMVYAPYDRPTEDLAGALAALKFSETSRTSGLTIETRMFGYAPRIPLRKDFCSATAMKRENPAEHETITGHAGRISEIYLEQAPTAFIGHAEKTRAKVRPEYQLPGGVFTSGVCNRNSPIAYHFDRGNYPGVWSAMIVLKRDCGGGFLSLPEFGLGIEVADRTLLLFDGQDILHGVTPIALRGARSYRYSVVYYSLKAMWNCQGRESELQRIKRVKTERERKRAGVNP